MTFLRTRLIKIGNSRGLRIPKAILDQLPFKDEVELEIQETQLIIRLPSVSRAGWDEQFAIMAEVGDDYLLDGDSRSLTEWDETEWEW